MPPCRILRSTRNQIQGVMHARGASYQLSYVPLLAFVLKILFILNAFHSTGVDVSTTLGSQFFPSLCGTQGLDSGCQDWQQPCPHAPPT